MGYDALNYSINGVYTPTDKGFLNGGYMRLTMVYGR